MRRFEMGPLMLACVAALTLAGCGSGGGPAAEGGDGAGTSPVADAQGGGGGAVDATSSADALAPGLDAGAPDGSVAPTPDSGGGPVQDTTGAPDDTSSPGEPDVITPDDAGSTTEPAEFSIPWSDGPYGVGIMDTGGDFTVQTLDGPWTLSEHWDGLSSYLFVFRYAANDYNSEVWNSDVKALLERAPDGAHLFFGSLDTTWSSDISGMRDRVDAALGQMGEAAQASWATRVHYINSNGFDMSGSALQFLNEQLMFWFGMDRFQRWREIGSLYDWNTDSVPIRFMANESLYFDYEAKIQAEMSDMNALEVTLWDAHTHPGGWGGGHSSNVDIDLPDAETLSKYDSMALYLYTACPAHKQGKDAGCNEWDYIQNLYLCDVATANPEAAQATSCTPGDAELEIDAETMACTCDAPDGTITDGTHTCNAEGTGFGDCSCGCGTEFARWVTPYGREGNWLTDLSPLLPLVHGGGTRRFRFAGANGYTLHGKLLFYDAGTGLRPVGIRYLWGNPGGTSFGESYNDGKHGDVAFHLPDGATHVTLTAIISGHGHSSTQQNCAEFCNHEHLFTVNGETYMENHPVAGTAYGCMEQTSDGGVPNQFGTWPYGRGGGARGWT